MTQVQLAAATTPPTNRSAVAHLEQGRRVPDPDTLSALRVFLGIPGTYWRGFLDNDYRRIAEFEDQLSELVGYYVSLEHLDDAAVSTAHSQALSLLDSDLTTNQTFDTFRSILVCYGVPPVSSSFLHKYFDADTFRSPAALHAAIVRYQRDAIRLFRTLRDAYLTFATVDDVQSLLSPLAPRDDDSYRLRTEWSRVVPIPEDRLPDLGYIAAERVRHESAERSAVSNFLRELASAIRKDGAAALDGIGDKKAW